MNKFAQNNLGRGPRRGALAHVRRKVLIAHNGAPKIRPRNTPSRGPIPKPHYLYHRWTRPTYDAKRHPDPIRRFFHNAMDRQTDRPTIQWTAADLYTWDVKSESSLCHQPSTSSAFHDMFARRTFSVVGPMTWNDLRDPTLSDDKFRPIQFNSILVIKNKKTIRCTSGDTLFSKYRNMYHVRGVLRNCAL